MAHRLLTRFNSFGYQRTFRAYHLTPVTHKLVQFVLSDIGEGIREVTIREWSIETGDKVSQFDQICLVESDKASVNITSRFDGIIKKCYYEIGDIALVGKPLVDIETGEEDEENVSTPAETPKQNPEPVSKMESVDLQVNKALAAPSVRRIAKEFNLSLKDVMGSGKQGRILKEDVLNYLNSQKTAIPAETSPRETKPIEATTVPITGIKKVMVNTMTASNAIPTFCYSEEINMSSLVKVRAEVKERAKKEGIQISYMPFFVKALSKALEKYPILNAVVDEKCENITYKPKHNIGVAMDTKTGLVVPNIKDVQSLSILKVALELDRLLKSGKNGVLSPADISGGTFTISNIGIIGGTYLKPLILPPELGIVALGKIQEKPIFDHQDNVVKGHLMCVTWAADHRVVDGATMARFSSIWKHYLEHPATLMLDL